MKKFLALCVVFLSAAIFASPAAAYSTLVQFSPTASGNGTDGSYSITGISEFDWASSGSAVVEQDIIDSSVAGATTYAQFLAGASNGSWVDITLHAQARLFGFLDSGGSGIAAPGLSNDGGATGTYEVTTTLDIVQRATYDNFTGNDRLTFTSASGTFAYFLDDSPDSIVATGFGFNDGDTTGSTPFLWGNVVSENVGSSFTAAGTTGSGASFLNNVILGYDDKIIETDPDSNSPLVGSTFDTTITLTQGGDLINVGGTIGGGPYPLPVGPISSYTVKSLDFRMNADSNSEFSASAIPEPSTIALFGFGLLGLAGAARRKRA